jgi:hypothetical protein
MIAPHPGAAHHSAEGEFDLSRTVTLKGTVTKVEWTNPHTYVELEAKDRASKTSTWRLEGSPPAFLRKAGLSKASLMADGKPVAIEAYPARDGTQRLGLMYKLILPDGRFYQFRAGPNPNAPH